jgi:YD repeat-containing protein
MKITKLLISMMALAVIFASCAKDDEDDEVQPQKRLVKVEITGSEYNQTDTYTYNENNQVVAHNYLYVSENSTTDRTTSYTYNAAGQPIQWVQTGGGYGDGTYTLTITSNSIVKTEPDGDEVTYTLNSNGWISEEDLGTFQYDYFYIGNNLDRREGLLSAKYDYDYSKNNVVPQLGIAHWTPMTNLVTKGWLYNYDQIADKSLLLEYTYDFNEDGTPASATMYNGFYPNADFYVTYTYEEY